MKTENTDTQSDSDAKDGRMQRLVSSINEDYLKYRVTPIIMSEDRIEIKTEMLNMQKDAMQTISREIINLKENAVKSALLKHG